MRPFITAFTITTALAIGARPAAARPADNGATATPQSQSPEAPATPPLPAGGGTEPIVLVLLGTGGIALLAGAAVADARVGRRRHRMSHSA